MNAKHTSNTPEKLVTPALSGALKEIDQTKRAEATAFILIWHACGKTDKERIARIMSWQAPDGPKAKDENGKEGDWYRVRLLHLTGYGKDLEKVAGMEKPTTVRASAEKMSGNSGANYLVRVLKDTYKVASMFQAVTAKGYFVSFVAPGDTKAYRPIIVSSKDKDSAYLSMPDFVRTDLDKLPKNGTAQQFASKDMRIARKRAAKSGQGGNKAEPVKINTLPKASQIALDLYNYFEGGAGEAVLKSGLSKASADYDHFWFLFRDLGKALFTPLPDASKKAWEDTFSRLPKPTTETQPVKPEAKPVEVPASVLIPASENRAAATMHKS